MKMREDKLEVVVGAWRLQLHLTSRRAGGCTATPWRHIEPRNPLSAPGLGDRGPQGVVIASGTTKQTGLLTEKEFQKKVCRETALIPCETNGRHSTRKRRLRGVIDNVGNVWVRQCTS